MSCKMESFFLEIQRLKITKCICLFNASQSRHLCQADGKKIQFKKMDISDCSLLWQNRISEDTLELRCTPIKQIKRSPVLHVDI